MSSHASQRALLLTVAALQFAACESNTKAPRDTGVETSPGRQEYPSHQDGRRRHGRSLVLNDRSDQLFVGGTFETAGGVLSSMVAVAELDPNTPDAGP